MAEDEYRWSSGQDLVLVTEFDNGRSLEEIALLLKAPLDVIKARLATLDIPKELEIAREWDAAPWSLKDQSVMCLRADRGMNVVELALQMGRSIDFIKEKLAQGQ